MKIYISGKVTGLPIDEVRQKFEKAESYLRELGHDPLNPLRNGLSQNHKWQDHLIADIQLLFGCEAIFMLPDWMNSRGALIEKYIAEICGFRIIFQIQQDEEAREKQRVEKIFNMVGTVIYEITGMSFKEYSVSSREEAKYFARLMFVWHSADNGISNKSMIARKINKCPASVHRALEKYPDELKYNSKFRQIAVDVSNRIRKHEVGFLEPLNN